MSERMYCDRIDWDKYEELTPPLNASDVILSFLNNHKSILETSIYATLNRYCSLYLEYRRVHDSIKNKKKYIKENSNSLNPFKIIKKIIYNNCINNERKEIWEIIFKLMCLEKKESITRIIKKHSAVIQPNNIAEEVGIRLKLDGGFY